MNVYEKLIAIQSELTKDARHYVEDEITKAKRNIEYYEGIIKVLEESN